MDAYSYSYRFDHQLDLQIYKSRIAGLPMHECTVLRALPLREGSATSSVYICTSYISDLHCYCYYFFVHSVSSILLFTPTSTSPTGSGQTAGMSKLRTAAPRRTQRRPRLTSCPGASACPASSSRRTRCGRFSCRCRPRRCRRRRATTASCRRRSPRPGG